MDPMTLTIGAAVLLVLTIVGALVIFRPGSGFSPDRAKESIAPLTDGGGPFTMKFGDDSVTNDSGEPLQDVLQMRDDDAGQGGPPMPKMMGQPTQMPAGLIGGQQKPPVPAPGSGGPVTRAFDPRAMVGGDGAAVPGPAEGQKDILNFTQPPAPKPGPNHEH